MYVYGDKQKVTPATLTVFLLPSRRS